jgi:hypothetical protein
VSMSCSGRASGEPSGGTVWGGYEREEPSGERSRSGKKVCHEIGHKAGKSYALSRVRLPMTVFGDATRESRMGPAGEHPCATDLHASYSEACASACGHLGNTRQGGAARSACDLAPPSAGMAGGGHYHAKYLWL